MLVSTATWDINIFGHVALEQVHVWNIVPYAAAYEATKTELGFHFRKAVEQQPKNDKANMAMSINVPYLLPVMWLEDRYLLSEDVLAPKELKVFTSLIKRLRKVWSMWGEGSLHIIT